MKKHMLIGIGLAFSTFMAIAQQKIKDGTSNGGNLSGKDVILELESSDKVIPPHTVNTTTSTFVQNIPHLLPSDLTA